MINFNTIGSIFDKKTMRERFLSEDDFKSKCSRISQLRKLQLERSRKRSEEFQNLLEAEKQEEIEKQKVHQFNEEIKQNIILERREQIQSRLEDKKLLK